MECLDALRGHAFFSKGKLEFLSKQMEPKQTFGKIKLLSADSKLSESFRKKSETTYFSAKMTMKIAFAVTFSLSQQNWV